MALSKEFLDSIRMWMDEDPDPETKSEIRTILDRSDSGDTKASQDLLERFGGRLTFGTAGIRGPVQGGPTGMNRVVVSQTTAGLATHLLANKVVGDPRTLRVVVGCDARTNSHVFLEDTLQVFSGLGIEAISLPPALPTPVLAFAIRHLGADAAVMITASHNPPQDNGYKVYFGGADNGSQIISPSDREIEAFVLERASRPFSEIPRSSENVVPAPQTIVDSYIKETIKALSVQPTGDERLNVVYTPLHGVGAETFLRTLEAAGFPAPHVVKEQQEPDAGFPTVSFPNPEEPGALDLAIELAEKIQADLILANDPDADRLAVALPNAPGGSDYRALTGNQLGAILGWRMATKAKAAGKTGALANSLVSSPVLGKVASHFELDHHETLTGFKYVSRVPHLIYGFEEALGYLVTPSVVRDKDGISAGLAVLDLAYELAEKGLTLWDYLREIEAAVGGFASSQITIRLTSQSNQPSISDQLRSNPPSKIGSRSITRADDFIDGFDDYPPENIIRYYLEDGSRVIIRPSGTEPKLKVYLDTEAPTRLEAEASLEALDRDVRQLLSQMSD